MIVACYEYCSWGHWPWCNFDVNYPEIDWDHTMDSSPDDPTIPEEVSIKVRQINPCEECNGDGTLFNPVRVYLT